MHRTAIWVSSRSAPGYSKEARETYCRAKKVILAEPVLEPEWQQRLGWLEQRLTAVESPGVSPC